MIVRDLPRKLVFIAVVTLASLAIYGLLLTQTGQHSPFTHRPSAFIMLPDAYELIPKADVREGGIKVGEVSSVDYQLDKTGVVSKIGVSMNPSYKLYRDAKVLLRTKTLANENYVALDPGTPRAGRLKDGQTLPISHAGETVQLDDLFGTLDPQTRAHVKHDLDAVGGGLDQHGDDFNEVLATAKPVGEHGRDVFGQLAGQRAQVGALVRDTSTLFQTMADRTQQIRTLSSQANHAAAAAASRDSQLADTIDTLPSTLDQAKSTLSRLGDFSQRQTPTMAELTDVTQRATPVLRDLGPTAKTLRHLTAVLPTAVERAQPLLHTLTPFSKHLKPAVSSLDDFLRELDPALDYLAPYSKEAGVFFGDNGSAIGKYDAAGNLGRVFPIGGPSTLTGVPDGTKKVLDLLQGANSDSARSKAESRNPLPGPGHNDNPLQFDGKYPRLQVRPPASGG